ncbi:MAG: endonuclease/exonuclease/phosphatase family protein [Pacificimonas sp.]
MTESKRRRVLRRVLAIVTCVLVVATALPLLASDAWWVRSLEFPRVQIALLLSLSLAALAAAGLRRAKLVIALGVLAFGYQAWRVFPYTTFASVQAKAVETCPVGQSVSIMVANVLQDNRDFDRLTTEVLRQNPDIFIALETDRGWVDALTPALGNDYPVRRVIPLDNTYGMALYSRMPFRALEQRATVEPDIPSLLAKFRLPSGDPFTLLALHPRPPIPGKDSGTRDAELVLAAIEVAQEDLPVIVAGDLNDVAWSDTTKLFQQLSGLLDPRVGRGQFPSFHADYPMARWPLDHIFFSDDFGLISFSRQNHVGSDHFPVSAALCLHPERMVSQQEGIAVEEDTVENAVEQLSNGLEQQAEEMSDGGDETQTGE